MKLTSKFVESITEPGRYYDDGAPGLFVLAQERKGKVRKSYVQRLTIHGKRVDIGLGSPRWGVTTPSSARAAAVKNYQIARRGGDPRQRAVTVPTFEAAADVVIRLHAQTWKNAGKSEAQWRASLRDYAFPRIGRMPVNAIGTADVLAVLMPIWNSKRETATRVRQRIGAVMKWAIAEGHRDDNPAGDAISEALPKRARRKQHHRALPYDRVSGAISKVRASNAYIMTALAFEFLVLTASRSGEIRGARWNEIDFDAATWTIPGERMKAGWDHRVPLSAAALKVLSDAREYASGSPLVFPSARDKVMSDATIGKLLTENGVDAVPHGFRSSFRQWAAERTNIPREVCEAALAHVNQDRVEAAYQRSDLFDRRRDLMDRWARYLSADTAANVVGF